MKPANSFLALLIFLASCGHSQTKNSQKALTGNIQSDLRTLLHHGKVIADIMDGVKQSQRQAELTRKFQTAIKDNYEWFLEYMKTVPEGEPMPYDPKLGLTKEEYTELTGYMENIEVVSTGKEDISIEMADNFILFNSNNKLQALIL